MTDTPSDDVRIHALEKVKEAVDDFTPMLLMGDEDTAKALGSLVSPMLGLWLSGCMQSRDLQTLDLISAFGIHVAASIQTIAQMLATEGKQSTVAIALASSVESLIRARYKEPN